MKKYHLKKEGKIIGLALIGLIIMIVLLTVENKNAVKSCVSGGNSPEYCKKIVK